MTKLYDEWRDSFNKDGPDYSIVERATGSSKYKLEDDLVANLGYYEALALGLMKSEKSIPHLKKALQIKSESNSIEAIARALWDIEGDSKYITVIASLLAAKGHDKFDRMRFIGLLTNVRHPKAFSALELALFDPDYLVRRCSASIYSYNSARQTSAGTIDRNVLSNDRKKIQKLADILSAKVHA